MATVALGACLWPVGCFDSDEKYQPAAGSTSTTGPITTTSSSSTSTSGLSSTTAAPDVTCRDAIDCVFACAAELQASMLPEPDLTCFLECEEGLNSDQVLDLFRLTECATNQCIALGKCNELVPTETSTGSESSSSSGSSSDTGTSSTTGGGLPENECFNCILAYVQDETAPGCMEFAAACQ